MGAPSLEVEAPEGPGWGLMSLSLASWDLGEVGGEASRSGCVEDDSARPRVGVACVGVRVLHEGRGSDAPEGPATGGSVVKDVSQVVGSHWGSPPSAHGLGWSSRSRSRGKQSGPPEGGGGAVPGGGMG